MYWLAEQKDQTEISTIRRFSPAYWTVNFSRPMMASVVSTGVDSMKIDLIFYRKEDLCGLIWESDDLYDHAFGQYETRRDYSDTRLSFRWQSQGIIVLDQLNGPTLTIEGRDQNGAARTWYVRLANYAVGSPEDAVISLDFDALDGGYLLPTEADPVYPADIDRLFISMVPPEYDGLATGPLLNVQEASVTITDLKVEGSTSTLKRGGGYVKPHQLRIANGYDDVYNLTPERVIWNMIQLGYRDWINHYVGMSHYFNLSWDAGAARYVIDPARAKLNKATESWHLDYFTRAGYFGFKIIVSLSYEILMENYPEGWQQKAFDGSSAQTGWSPPSTLIAPTNQTALDYLRDVFVAFGTMQQAAGLALYMQIGEPWWWVSLGASQVPYFYDTATTTLYTTETGNILPAMHQTIAEAISAEQQTYLNWLGDKLGQSTLWLRDQIKLFDASAQVGLLFYTPQVLLEGAPMVASVNLPAAYWASPAFDFFQAEDYDHVINGDWAAHETGLKILDDLLHYPKNRMHYFSGFNLLAATPENWQNIDHAITDGFARAYEETFVWAYPQIVRDGFIYNHNLEKDMSGFHEIRLPADIGFGASGGPVFATSVVEMASGHEQRNQEWAEARIRYDVGLGLRSENDVAEMISFFRARAGRAYGFRFKDWSDYKSGLPENNPAATDQIVGTGDGSSIVFQLVKTYVSGALEHKRNITKPVTGTVMVALDGVSQASGWQVDDTNGQITFDVAPALGVSVTAGFEFDVPVRFTEDHLFVTQETFRAGDIPAIPLIELRL